MLDSLRNLISNRRTRKSFFKLNRSEKISCYSNPQNITHLHNPTHNTKQIPYHIIPYHIMPTTPYHTRQFQKLFRRYFKFNYSDTMDIRLVATIHNRLYFRVYSLFSFMCSTIRSSPVVVSLLCTQLLLYISTNEKIRCF